MNNEYESIIHQIDKIFWKTSEANTDKKYRDMNSNQKYKEVMKNPDKLILKLEQLY
jgi:predicted acetyltransferase